ncbi:hypothetical protein RD792_014465 [Penstemon davidsonii]|uniref:Ribosomal protein L23 n=1 Tax=Penstemon davidsonii TaxID=160366 RepID=A0ABR0CRT0_9LAMI|nr:hypothetical protein RD792_014465 [Penstemon davidsonii]
MFVDDRSLEGKAGFSRPLSLVGGRPSPWQVGYQGNMNLNLFNRHLLLNLFNRHLLLNLFNKHLNTGSTRTELKHWVELFFGVKVIAMNSHRLPGKGRRMGPIMGHTMQYRRMIITLQPGYSIPLLAGERAALRSWAFSLVMEEAY